MNNSSTFNKKRVLGQYSVKQTQIFDWINQQKPYFNGKGEILPWERVDKK
jgi:hypothetical protein